MKILFLLFAALLVSGCREKSASDSGKKSALEQAVDLESLEGTNDIYYHPDELEPYNGWAKEMHGSGQVMMLGRFKDGKREGPWPSWNKHGQKAGEVSYKDGKRDGLQTLYFADEQKQQEIHYKNGKRHGPYREWHTNGQMRSEGTYIDGKADGVWTSWRAEGQKKIEYSSKDGERNGWYTTWHVNGQMQVRRFYIDGGSRSTKEKYWNSKGEEVETWEEAKE